jgi:hypothetical protein
VTIGHRWHDVPAFREAAAAVASDRIEVRGVVTARSSWPDPKRAPYRDALYVFAVRPGSGPDRSAVFVVASCFRQRVLCSGTIVSVGDDVALSLCAWDVACARDRALSTTMLINEICGPAALLYYWAGPAAGAR